MTPHPLSEEARGTGWAEMAEELPRGNTFPADERLGKPETKPAPLESSSQPQTQLQPP